jgi:hypothetical protein
MTGLADRERPLDVIDIGQVTTEVITRPPTVQEQR